MKCLNLVIVAQEDGFFLPGVIEKIINLPAIDLKRIVLIDSKGSLENNKLYFLKMFGITNAYKLMLKYMFNMTLDKVDFLAGYACLQKKRSLQGLAKKHGVPYLPVKNINSEHAYSVLAEDQPDLIFSFSAPQVFRERILSLPRYTVLNVHGSFLPDYRGIMPGFWVLANGENYTGVTIHRMADGIDEGEILFQEKVDISDCRTMFEVIGKTKKAGGALALKALDCYCNHPEAVCFKPNPIAEGRYFSWPKKEDVKKFIDRGFRLA